VGATPGGPRWERWPACGRDWHLYTATACRPSCRSISNTGSLCDADWLLNFAAGYPAADDWFKLATRTAHSGQLPTRSGRRLALQPSVSCRHPLPSTTDRMSAQPRIRCHNVRRQPQRRCQPVRWVVGAGGWRGPTGGAQPGTVVKYGVGWRGTGCGRWPREKNRELRSR
jgi:hypothetical protein